MFRKKSGDSTVESNSKNILESPVNDSIPRQTRTNSAGSISRIPFRRKSKVAPVYTTEPESTVPKTKSLKDRFSILRRKSKSNVSDTNEHVVTLETVGELTKESNSDKKEIIIDSIQSSDPVAAEIEQMIVGLVDKIIALESRIEEQTKENEKLENELGASKSKFEDLKQKFLKEKEWQYEAELLGSKVKKYEQAIFQLEAKLNETQKELSISQNETITRSEVSKKDKIRIDDLLQTIKELQNDKTILQKKIVDLDQKYNSAVSLESSLINTHGVELSKAKVLIDEYQTIISNLQNQIQIFEENEKKHVSEEQKKLDVTDLLIDQQEIQSLSTIAVNNSSKLVELAREKSYAEWKLINLSAHHNLYKKEKTQLIIDLNTEFDKLQSENRQQAEIISALEKKNLDLCISSNSLLKEKITMNELNYMNQVESRLEVSLIDLEATKNELNRLKKQNLQLKENLELQNQKARDIEEIRHMDALNFNILQDELYYTKSNYRIELEELSRRTNVAVQGLENQDLSESKLSRKSSASSLEYNSDGVTTPKLQTENAENLKQSLVIEELISLLSTVDSIKCEKSFSEIHYCNLKLKILSIHAYYESKLLEKDRFISEFCNLFKEYALTNNSSGILSSSTKNLNRIMKKISLNVDDQLKSWSSSIVFQNQYKCLSKEYDQLVTEIEQVTVQQKNLVNELHNSQRELTMCRTLYDQEVKTNLNLHQRLTEENEKLQFSILQKNEIDTQLLELQSCFQSDKLNLESNCRSLEKSLQLSLTELNDKNNIISLMKKEISNYEQLVEIAKNSFLTQEHELNEVKLSKNNDGSNSIVIENKFDKLESNGMITKEILYPALYDDIFYGFIQMFSTTQEVDILIPKKIYHFYRFSFFVTTASLFVMYLYNLPRCLPISYYLLMGLLPTRLWQVSSQYFGTAIALLVLKRPRNEYFVEGQ